MNKIRLLAFLTALSCMVAPLTGFAEEKEEGGNTHQYDANIDFGASKEETEQIEVPTAASLAQEVQVGWEKKDFPKIKEVSAQDYSDYVAKTEKITVTIDENDMWEYNKEVFGLQIEAADEYAVYYNNGQLKQEFLDMVERGAGGIPNIRMGGSASNTVNPLLGMIGPAESRKGTPEGTYKKATDTFYGGGAAPYMMGIPEWLKVFEELNGGNTVSYTPCIPLWVMPPEDIANLARYFYDDKDESEWGAMRAADGYPDPINVYYWELGNELEYRTFRTQVMIDEYVNKAIPAIEAIKSVNPDAKILINGVTGPWGAFWGIPEYSGGASWTAWHMGIMPRLVKYADAISHHVYYDGYAPELSSDYFTEKIKRDVAKMVEEQDIRDENGNLKDIKIIATEHNRYTAPAECNINFHSAMAIAHYYNTVFAHPWYIGANLHCSHGGWCAFWYTHNNDFILTPTAKMHKLYYESAGDRICKSSWVRHEEDGTIYDPLAHLKDDISNWRHAETFSVCAMPSGEHELKVFLVNKKAYEQREITFDFKHHSYTLVKEERLVAPNAATIAVDRESEEYTRVETKELNIPNCTTYTTPTQGLVVLTFRTEDRMLQLGEKAEDKVEGGVADAPEAEELAFLDIADSFAKNEITALANQGLINGKGEGIYAPKDDITRGEFAYILAKAMNLKEYKGNLIKDVPQDKWYSGMINSLYIENVIDGIYFRPDDKMTLRELMEWAGELCKNADMQAETGEILGIGFSVNADAAYAINKGVFSKLLQRGILYTDRSVTREEAAAVMYKLSKLI